MNGTVGEIVFSGDLVLALPISFLAGLLAFLSPCVIPLIAGYIAYVSGFALADGIAVIALDGEALPQQRHDRRGLAGLQRRHLRQRRPAAACRDGRIGGGRMRQHRRAVGMEGRLRVLRDLRFRRWWGRQLWLRRCRPRRRGGRGGSWCHRRWRGRWSLRRGNGRCRRWRRQVCDGRDDHGGRPGGHLRRRHHRQAVQQQRAGHQAGGQGAGPRNAAAGNANWVRHTAMVNGTG